MNINLTAATRIGLNLLALLGVAVALYLGESIFVPLTIAVLLAAILWPVAEWLYRRGIPWSISCMLAVGILIIVFGVITLGFTLSVSKMLQGLPRPNDTTVQVQYYEQFRKQVIRVSPVSVDPVLPEDADRSRLFIYVRDTINSSFMTNLLLNLAGYLRDWALEFVLVMFILLFLLMEGRMLTQRIVEIFGPSQEAQQKALMALEKMVRSVRTYLIWRTVVNLGLGLVLGVVYQSVGLQHPWTWALLAVVLCYIPYIGTILAGAPPVLDAFVNLDNPWWALGVLVFYVAIVTFEGYFIVPWVMGRGMNLNATTVMLSCLFWYLVWGNPGLFLAMPLMAALKAVCETVPGWRPFANLMGTDEAPAAPEPAAPIPSANGDKTVVDFPVPADPEKTAVMDGAVAADKTALMDDAAGTSGSRGAP